MSTNYPHLRQAQRAIWFDRRLSTTEKHVGVYLLNRMNDDFTRAFPAIATMCLDLELGRSTVHRSLDRLVELGWFEKAPIPGLRGVRAYSVLDIDFVVKLASQHASFEKSRRTARLAELAASRSDLSHSGTCPTAGHVPERDMCQSGTGTYPTVAQVPVPQWDTDRPIGSAQGSAQGSPAHGAKNSREASSTHVSTTIVDPPLIAAAPSRPPTDEFTKKGGILNVDLGWVGPDTAPATGEYVVKDVTHYDHKRGSLVLMNGVGTAWGQEVAKKYAIEISEAIDRARPWMRAGMSDVERKNVIEREAQKLSKPAPRPAPRRGGGGSSGGGALYE